MKKRNPLCSLFMICFLLAGCLAGGNRTGTLPRNMKDGIYEATGHGRNGDFEVRTVISDGKISLIQIGENTETPDRGDKAMQQMAEKIVSQQSLNVDTISEATISSQALLTAVSECVDQAAVNR